MLLQIAHLWLGQPCAWFWLYMQPRPASVLSCLLHVSCCHTILQAKTRELKQTLNTEFRSIHELCMFVLGNTRKTELIKATLTALAAYLSWIPPGYIFEGQLVQALLAMFPQAPFRNVALQCLTEVSSDYAGSASLWRLQSEWACASSAASVFAQSSCC